MAASSRAQVLRLYRALLRESQRFGGYNYRCGEGLRGAAGAGLPAEACGPGGAWGGGAAASGDPAEEPSRALPGSDSGTGTGPGPGSESREWAAPGLSARPRAAAIAPGHGLCLL